jgi:predicted nucleotide-binding protein
VTTPHARPGAPPGAAPAARRRRPHVFIGSSSEQLDVAHAVQLNLERHCDCTVWDQRAFALSSTILDDLLARLDQCDFGIFVFGPDDLVTIRDRQFATTRDNVVFELGLFIGRLGRERTFVVMPRDVGDFRLPSDLLGVTPAEYDGTRPDVEAALGPACTRIRTQVAQLGVRPERVTVDEVAITSVLVVVVPGFATGGVEEDVAILEATFPGRLVHREVRTPEALAQAVAETRPQLLHLVADVSGEDGHLLFPATNAGERPRMAPERLAAVLARHTPALVVIAACDSLLARDRIAHVTNVVAASSQILVETIVRWQAQFYPALGRGESLSSAFEYAMVTDAPMSLRLLRDFTVAR